MQQLRQYPGSEPSSSIEPRVPRIPIGSFDRVRSNIVSSWKSQKPRRILFQGSPLRVFHFAPAYTQNGKLGVGKTWSEFDQNVLRPVYIDQKDFDQSIELFKARSSYTIQSTTGGKLLDF